jgi:hypothetical protein
MFDSLPGVEKNIDMLVKDYERFDPSAMPQGMPW